MFLLLLMPTAGWCDIEIQWGGYLRVIGTVSWQDSESIYRLSGEDDPYYDGQAEGRLNNQIFFGPHWRLETHYELVAQAGDTVKANNQLRGILGAGSVDRLIGRSGIDDRRRLMDLTDTIDDGSGHLIYQRLDRLNLTWEANWGTMRLGRQALTWGNGLIFNPMDLFNPFAPTTVQRDYKSGEDMVYLQHPVGDGEIQLLFVPRRDPISNDVEEEQASYAGKWRMTRSPYEFDLMAARHFGDAVFGAGITGFWGGAAWRLDALYTRLDDDQRRDHYWQAVANIDYAWRWGRTNFYGLLEYFHNGLGRNDDYASALADPDVIDRLQRGELFTLGKNYLAGRLQADLHPLVNAGLATIVNLSDESVFLQPQLVWDINTDWQAILGGGFYWGDNGSEYGGYAAFAGTNPVTIAPADSVYLWLTYYF